MEAKKITSMLLDSLKNTDALVLILNYISRLSLPFLFIEYTLSKY